MTFFIRYIVQYQKEVAILFCRFVAMIKNIHFIRTYYIYVGLLLKVQFITINDVLLFKVLYASDNDRTDNCIGESMFGRIKAKRQNTGIFLES